MQSIRFGEIKQNKGYYAVSPMSVPIERCDFLLVIRLIVIDILSRTVLSYRRLLVKFWTLRFTASFGGLGSGLNFGHCVLQPLLGA